MFVLALVLAPLGDGFGFGAGFGFGFGSALLAPLLAALVLAALLAALLAVLEMATSRMQEDTRRWLKMAFFASPRVPWPPRDDLRGPQCLAWTPQAANILFGTV